MPSRRHNSICSVLLALVFVVSCAGTLHAQTFENIPSISFTKVFGGVDPLPQVLTVASATATSFNFTYAATTSSGNWLSVASPGCGACSTPNVVTATVTTSAAMPVGVYPGQIVFTVYGGVGSITVPVTLTVATAGSTYFDNLPGQLSFTSMTAVGTPPSQRIQIRNGGTGTLTWNLVASTYNNGGNWLNVSATSGTAPSFLDISVSIRNLPGGGLTAGTFVGMLSFTAAGSSVTVPIEVVVGADVFDQENPISFTKPYGAGVDPLPQVLTIASTGASFNFTYDSATATGGSWLAIASPGCGACATPNVITATVKTSPTMAPGTYTAQIVLTQYTNPATSITIPVTLTVGPMSGGDFFDDVPGQLTYSLVPAGGNPPVQTVSIRDVGSGSLNWNATASTADGGNWLVVSPHLTVPRLHW
jgi:Viral BACON domain